MTLMHIFNLVLKTPSALLRRSPGAPKSCLGRPEHAQMLLFRSPNRSSRATSNFLGKNVQKNQVKLTESCSNVPPVAISFVYFTWLPWGWEFRKSQGILSFIIPGLEWIRN